jgi:hypothetical protein
MTGAAVAGAWPRPAISHRRRVGLFSLGLSSVGSKSAVRRVDFSRSVGSLIVLIARSTADAASNPLQTAS